MADRNYFRKRAAEMRELGTLASDPGTKAQFLRLAMDYELLAARAEELNDANVTPVDLP